MGNENQKYDARVPDTGTSDALLLSRVLGFAVDALVLLAIALLMLRPLALTNLIPGSGDAFDYFIPYRAYAAHALRSGRVPLWDPYLFMGVPFLANIQAAVLYPLHWPLISLNPGRAVAWSMVLHIYLLALFTYLYARVSAGSSRTGALTAGTLLAFGGFVSGAAMHLNQLNVFAWFPLALLLWDVAIDGRAFVGTVGLSVIIAMMLLAGHTQATFISLVGIGLYGGWRAWVSHRLAKGEPGKERSRADVTRRGKWSVLRSAGSGAFGRAATAYLGAGAIAALLSAAQLLPTLELSRYSLRQGGLTYRQVVSFSLHPTKLLWTLLPPYGVDLSQKFGTAAFSEYVAYLPILGWFLVVVGILWLFGKSSGKASALRDSQKFYPMVALVGFLLALGGYDPVYYLLYKAVPGFDLFRAPARWMFLASFGLAMSAGVGMDALPLPSRTNIRPLARLLLFAALIVELKVAICAMPISHPTAPEALESMRNPVAFLLSDPSVAWGGNRDDDDTSNGMSGPGRVLSISDIRFDPGDLQALKESFSPYLTRQGMYDLIVDTKEKEIVAPNLSLYFGIQAVDGYDGGLLPLKRYNELLHLFLPEKEIVPDGRLREQLKRIPPQRLLDLLNVKYVITDKVYDKWIDGKYFDLQQTATVDKTAELDLNDLPSRPITHIGVVWSGGGGKVEAISTDGRTYRWNLSGGTDRRIELPGGKPATLTVLPIPSSSDICTLVVLKAIRIHSDGRVAIHGVTAWDERTGSHWAVSLPRPSNLERVFSGDVKIYRNRDFLPRAYFVREVRCVESDDEALKLMADVGFEPSRLAILDAPEKACAAANRTDVNASVKIVKYEPERIELMTQSDEDAYLVLSDSYYPGWKAKVDGVDVPIVRADVLFRAVEVPRGQHKVEFVYDPWTWKAGAAISIATVLLLVIVGGFFLFHSRR